MNEIEFGEAFEKLTGYKPFPWQWTLYDKWFKVGKFPESCNLPTGLGKTSVIAVWLIALSKHPDRIPRRLVYVVNRRTVVDQTTDEVEKYLKNTAAAGVPEFAVSTLRGQFADNGKWCEDPSRPAVVCGTVDMIGSRLLFSGYGIGRGKRPLHAGFLGQDALLVHDEAHLEPAFQKLIEAIRDEQTRCNEFGKLRVMELTATSRGSGEVFGLTDRDLQNATAKERVEARKSLHLHELKDPKKLAEQLIERAKTFEDKNRAVLVFARTVEDVMKVADKLPNDRVLTLTGTMRGKERDGLIEKPLFRRFLPGGQSDDPTTYLVCTSAGEVGVNISADHLVCDLSTFENMAQRFGRVNRFGKRGDTEIHVVHPTEFEKKDYEQRLEKTLGLLKELEQRNRDASPAALGRLDQKARTDAFAPTPTILPTTDILFDAWALTTIRDKLPGRPPVEPYLHGVTDDQYDTEFAWRKEVELLTCKVPDDAIAELLDAAPLKPHETLRVPTFGKKNGAYFHLELIRERTPKAPVWVIEPNGDVTAYPTLAELLKTTDKGEYTVSLTERTVVLPPKAGGLTANGTLQGGEPYIEEGRQYDVAGTPPPKVAPLVRLLVTPGEEETIEPVAPASGWPPDAEITRAGRTFRVTGQPRLRVVFALDLPDPDDEDAPPRQYVVVRPIKVSGDTEADPAWPALDKHLKGVAEFAKKITAGLTWLDPKIAAAVIHAAEWHDLGKGRAVWQRGAGNRPTNGPVAKTLHGRAPENLNHYRHELGSMVDVATRLDLSAAFDRLDADQQDVVLHLIAAHHGRGRPHFPGDEGYDVERPADDVAAVAADTPSRFARLQRTFGRWGLAYLESLLRAADALESRRIEAAPLPEAKDWPKVAPLSRPDLRTLAPRLAPTPTITVAVDPTNPGQFFACCGLLELADRLWPGAEGWFAEGGREFRIARGGTLDELLQQLSTATISSSLTDAELKRLDTLQSMDKRKLTPEIEAEKDDLRTRWRVEQLHLSKPFDLWMDWWHDETGERTDLKTWAAKVRVLGMVREFHKLVKTLRWDVTTISECLTKSVRADVTPFYFDSDAGAQGSAQDAGFSAYDLRTVIKGHAPARPLIELGSFFAFQRFRPIPVAGTDRYRYSTWTTPLPVSVASVVAVAAVEVPGTQLYEFSLFSRTQYMKTFLPAIPLGGSR